MLLLCCSAVATVLLSMAYSTYLKYNVNVDTKTKEKLKDAFLQIGEK